MGSAANRQRRRALSSVGRAVRVDEPYMDVAFFTMLRKRAGGLTALFLGEMLTATAMGAFEHEISRAEYVAFIGHEPFED